MFFPIFDVLYQFWKMCYPILWKHIFENWANLFANNIFFKIGQNMIQTILDPGLTTPALACCDFFLIKSDV